MTSNIYLRCANADIKKSAECTMRILNTIQDTEKSVQLMASCTVFLCLIKRYNIRPDDLLLLASNMIRKSRGYSRASFEALYTYMKNELED